MKKYILIATVFFLAARLNAQVGIGTSLPHSSAKLEVSSNNSGLLIPRMTSAQRNAIASPAKGLLVFDTDTNGFWYHNGSSWTTLTPTATGWTLTGNSGTIDGTNFIGTLNNVPLNFKVNNVKAGRIDHLAKNTFLGYQAGSTNTMGRGNTAYGYYALLNNTFGFVNTAVGENVLTNNTTGNYNTATGSHAPHNNTTSDNNTATGAYALYNSTGNDNSAMGYEALYLNTAGNENTATGRAALYYNTSGNGNTALGYNALISNTTGNANTAIGYAADVIGSNFVNATAIGYNAKVGASNSLVLGGTGANAVKVGIGVNEPVATLHVKGIEKIFNGANAHTGNFYNGTSTADGIELVSTSATNAYIGVQSTTTFGLHISKSSTTNNNGLAAFFVNGNSVGSITTNGTTTSYNITSDYRLKENLTTSRFGLNTLMKINVEDYNYIFDSKKALQTGFMAQQLYAVYPQAVHVGGNDAQTNPWMVDYSKMTPLLVKSIQEQQQIIENQSKKINSLEERLKKLEAQILQ